MASSELTAPDAGGQAPVVAWRRMHPVTPLVDGWRVVIVAMVVVVHFVSDQVISRWLLGDRGPDARGPQVAVTWPLVTVMAVAVVCTAVAFAAVGYVLWWARKYRITDDALFVHSGILFKQFRKAPLDRLQSVEIKQPLLARVFGLAAVVVEVAGGSKSQLSLRFVPLATAIDLRQELLQHHQQTSGGGGDDAEALCSLKLGRLAASTVLGPVVVLAVMVPVASVMLLLWLVMAVPSNALTEQSARDGMAVLLTFLGVNIPAILGIIGYFWTQFSRYFGFTVQPADSGVRISAGLLETRSVTVPVAKIQAIKITQPMLWRPFDWWRIWVNVAGTESDTPEANHQLQSVVLPVGSVADVMAVLRNIAPSLAAGSGAAAVAQAMTGRGDQGGFVPGARAGRWLNPLSWWRTGCVATAEAVVIRRGIVVRQAVIVPHAKCQSLAVTRGPVQALAGVVTVWLHSTPGPVSPAVPHLEPDVAGELLQQQAARSLAARESAVAGLPQPVVGVSGRSEPVSPETIEADAQRPQATDQGGAAESRSSTSTRDPKAGESDDPPH